MRDNKEIKERIAAHFMENEGGAVSDPQLAEWLEESGANRKLFYQYKRIWEESAYYMTLEEFDTERAWENIHAINQKKRHLGRRWKNAAYILSGVAASLLVLFVLSHRGLLDEPDELQMSLTTSYGNRSEVCLPDGSVIQLNAGSDITYIYDAQAEVRKVRFQGEGFFDVTESKTPFVVQMDNEVEIRVLGTSFNLRAYADDPTIQASLIEGSIEMSHNKDRLLMKAGDMSVFDKETNELMPVTGTLSHSYGWLENKLYMENMSLNEVCKYLERWYNVQITLQPGLGKKIHYNGVIKEETITEVLDALSRLSDIRYTVKGKQISITSK